MRTMTVVFAVAVAIGAWPVVGQNAEADKRPSAQGKRYLYKHSGGKPLAEIGRAHV